MTAPVFIMTPQEALARAEQHAQVVAEQGQEIRELVASLREIRERNMFAERIIETIRRTP